MVRFLWSIKALWIHFTSILCGWWRCVNQNRRYADIGNQERHTKRRNEGELFSAGATTVVMKLLMQFKCCPVVVVVVLVMDIESKDIQKRTDHTRAFYLGHGTVFAAPRPKADWTWSNIYESKWAPSFLHSTGHTYTLPPFTLWWYVCRPTAMQDPMTVDGRVT